MDFRHMTAPCGLDCFNCPMFLASSNEEVRNAVAKELEIAPNEVQCKGCRNHDGLIAHQKMNKSCRIFECARQRKHHFCSDCDDFPCDFLHPTSDEPAMMPCNIQVFNLSLIKKMGVDKWAQYKAKKSRQKYYENKYQL